VPRSPESASLFLLVGSDVVSEQPAQPVTDAAEALTSGGRTDRSAAVME
jgi:hypothetical protein